MAYNESPEIKKFRQCRHELKLIADPNREVKWMCRVDLTEGNPIWQCQLCGLNLCNECYKQYMDGEIQWDSVNIYQ